MVWGIRCVPGMYPLAHRFSHGRASCSLSAATFYNAGNLVEPPRLWHSAPLRNKKSSTPAGRLSFCWHGVCLAWRRSTGAPASLTLFAPSRDELGFSCFAELFESSQMRAPTGPFLSSRPPLWADCLASDDSDHGYVCGYTASGVELFFSEGTI